MLSPFELWPGTLGTLARTPDRYPGSIRRTTTIQSIWLAPDYRTLLLTARGRDLLTGTDSGAVVTDTCHLDMRAVGREKTVEHVESDPPIPNLRLLEGSKLSGGFRRIVGTTLAVPPGSVTALILDDLPAAAFVSTAAPVRAAIEATGHIPALVLKQRNHPAVCIGHRPDGVMAQRRQEGRPLMGQGPPAGSLDRPDDPLAWPEEPAPPVHGMRRTRRIDVRVLDSEVLVDTHFRDSYREGSGLETVMHEYEVLARARADELVVRDIEVRPRVLPGPDCPAAAASAQAVVGSPFEQLRAFVRAELNDDTVCTHLNDQLRSLADVPGLVEVLQRRP
jgi:hypothetical protein